MVPVEEQIEGSYRRYVRIIYKIVSSGVVNNIMWVFKKINIKDKRTIIFIKHYEENDSM